MSRKEDITMRMVDLIVKKRQGQALSAAEIAWMIQAYTEGAARLPDVCDDDGNLLCRNDC